MTDLGWHFSVLATQPHGVWLRGANDSFILLSTSDHEQELMC